MNKIVTYQGNEYGINYKMEISRNIGATVHHIMEILSVNGKLIPMNAYKLTYYHNDLTVKEMALTLIKSYLESNTKPKYIIDFEEWDGNLDN